MLNINQAAAHVLLKRAVTAHDHAGLSYEQASRKGQALCQAAGESGCWLHLASHLEQLAQQMTRGTWRDDEGVTRSVQP